MVEVEAVVEPVEDEVAEVVHQEVEVLVEDSLLPSLEPRRPLNNLLIVE